MALTDKLTAIGDAIRTKTGGTDLLTLDQMATEIANISGGGGGERGVLKTMLLKIGFNSTNIRFSLPSDFQFPCFISISASSSSSQHSTLTYGYSHLRYNFIMIDDEGGEIKGTLLNCQTEDGGMDDETPFYSGVRIIRYNPTTSSPYGEIQVSPIKTEYFSGAGKKMADTNAKVYYWPKQ